MFDQIFGNYLVKTGRITKEQLSDVIESESKVRVKLGLIAVADRLMRLIIYRRSGIADLVILPWKRDI